MHECVVAAARCSKVYLTQGGSHHICKRIKFVAVTRLSVYFLVQKMFL